MDLATFNEYAGVLSNFNACREFFSWTASGIIKAIRYRWNTPQLPDKDNTPLQHEIQEEIEQLKDGLWKLKATMPKMLDLMDRVEWQSHKKQAADLLPVIKDAVYDAEDLLDEFDYYELKLKLERSKNPKQDHWHHTFLEFLDSVGSNDYMRDVQRIQEKLDHVYLQSRDMGLHQAPLRFDKSVRPETSSFFVEPKIFGRENELNQLMEELGVSARKRSRTGIKTRMTEFVVLSIVGIGGVGKTTMAQQICDHAKVKKHFDHIIWTCVSDDFDIKRLTKEIIQHLGGDASSDNLNDLLRKQKECVESKKFLLVLDDMWDDILGEDGARWNRFCEPLKNGAQGSRILVTTRSLEVANLVGPMYHYDLKGLHDAAFWDFFKFCAFGSMSSCNNRETLECIGKYILPKLKGSPLAAKTIGRLLRMDLSTTHWKNIVESELWQVEQTDTDILPALRLSYMYLPQKLKRCFSICAMYPKDHIFGKDLLADIWIAQGYVMDPQEASLCFDALANRSFFQKASHVSDEYVIHDLMHDTAQLVSKDECFIIKHATDLYKIPPNVRHLSIFANGNVACSQLKKICNKKKLRSLVCNESYSRAKEDFASLIDCWFKELPRIRALSLKVHNVSQLPDSTGNSKHLRYLCLHGNSSFGTFPSSVCRLHHLKIIDRGGCAIQRLPPGFSDAISLQKIISKGFVYNKDHSDKLCLKWFCQETSREKEEMMENQMEALPHWNLRHLHVERYGGKSCPSWLRPNLLPRLCSLEFHGCDKINSMLFFVDGSPDNTAGTDNHNHLEELIIDNCNQINWQGSLVLPTSLRKIFLCRPGYSMDNFVSCFHDLTSLTYLRIDWCDSLTSLPLHISSLEELDISICHHLTSISVSGASSSRNSSSVRGFSSLAKIHIKWCSTLLSLDELLMSHNLNRLEELVIENCDHINWQGSVVLPTSIRKLTLQDSGYSMDHFVSGFRNLSSLTYLKIDWCDDLTCIPLHVWSSNLPSLEELHISLCNYLTSISVSGASSSAVTGFSSLAKIHIESCSKLLSLDELMTPNYLPAAKTICVKLCKELTSLSVEGLDGLQEMNISGCPKLNSQRIMTFPFSLRKLSLSECEGIESIEIDSSQLGSSLEELEIRSCPGLRSIGGATAVAKIKKVDIRECPELKEIQQPLIRGEWA